MREKLIELLWKYDQMRMMRMSIEECTDHLIANGVTVQKWIPVTERLPEEDDKYLCAVKGTITGYSYTKVMWYSTKRGFHYSDPDLGDMPMNSYVTHWMPLPDPPKGE